MGHTLSCHHINILFTIKAASIDGLMRVSLVASHFGLNGCIVIVFLWSMFANKLSISLS